jgi:hypothetical protein
MKKEATFLDLIRVQELVANHMDKMKKLFRPGVKIAVLVRTPGIPERDFVMTDDALPELRKMLDRRGVDAGQVPIESKH